ncbi:MAG: hypothetical protein AB8B93_19155 [Pseudomonadales bacterium]
MMANAVAVDYTGSITTTFNGVPETQTLTGLPAAPIDVARWDIDDPDRGSTAALNAYVANESNGVSYGAASSGAGEFVSFNNLNISDTITVDGAFSEYFISFDILAGATSITGMSGNQRAAFGFDVSINGTRVFDASVNVERNDASGLQTVNSDAGANNLVGFSEFSGSTTGASWDSTTVTLQVVLADPAALDTLFFEVGLQTFARGSEECDGPDCGSAESTFDDPLGRFGRPVLRCLPLDSDNPAPCQSGDDDPRGRPVDLPADLFGGLFVDGDGVITTVIPPRPGGGPIDIPTSAVPAPGSLVLLTMGIVALVRIRRRHEPAPRCAS